MKIKISVSAVTKELVSKKQTDASLKELKSLKAKFDKTFIDIEKSISSSLKQNDPDLLDIVDDRLVSLKEALSDYESEFLLNL